MKDGIVSCRICGRRMVLISRFLVGCSLHLFLWCVCVCFALCSCYKIVFTCADPESFDRGGPNLINFFF